jgi:hypothetical protein
VRETLPYASLRFLRRAGAVSHEERIMDKRKRKPQARAATLSLALLFALGPVGAVYAADDPSQQVQSDASKVGQKAHDAGETVKQAGVDVGHQAKDTGVEVGHAARQAGSDVGGAAKSGYHTVKDAVREGYETVKASASNFWHSLKGD